MPRKKNPTQPKESASYFSLRLPDDLRRQVEAMHTKRRGHASFTDIILAALRAYFDPEEADKKDMALLRRLEAMDRQLTLLKRQNETVAEAFGTFVKLYFTDMEALMEAADVTDKAIEMAELHSDSAYKNYLEGVAKKLNYGGEFFRNLPDQVFDPGQFATREIEDAVIDTEEEPVDHD